VTVGATELTPDHVNLSIEPGEMFGLLGPNGAGKTTTICGRPNTL
jgi:ABC-2 type transport system ATP-binding protein